MIDDSNSLTYNLKQQKVNVFLKLFKIDLKSRQSLKKYMRDLAFFWAASVISLNFAFAQSNFSESFIDVPKNIQVYVPSGACIDKDLQSDFIYKTYVGKLSIIRTYYADLNINLTKNKDSDTQVKHVVGAGLYNDREGDIFNKTRIISRYAAHLPLRENLFLSLGTAFHLVNYNFHPSGSGASGSDLNWTGSFSTMLYASNFKLAISLNDFNNPIVTPINYTFNIYRYITLYGEKLFDLNQNTQFKCSARCNSFFGKPNTYILHGGLVLSKIVGVNGFYYATKGYGFTFDINSIKINKSNLDFSLAYQIPQKQVAPAANQYEVNLRYCIPNNR